MYEFCCQSLCLLHPCYMSPMHCVISWYIVYYYFVYYSFMKYKQEIRPKYFYLLLFITFPVIVPEEVLGKVLDSTFGTIRAPNKRTFPTPIKRTLPATERGDNPWEGRHHLPVFRNGEDI